MNLELPWADIRSALTAAIMAALPLQVRKAGNEPIAGIGLHMDAYYGSAGLYLLPESAAQSLSSKQVDNIGDWPISTDWDPQEDHARAFAAHWGRWDSWIHAHLDDLDDISDEKFRGLLQVSCEAMRAVELAGTFETFRKATEFRIIICEHDEPNDLALERYSRFVNTGTIVCHGDNNPQGLW